jgi:hypothetical protein
VRRGRRPASSRPPGAVRPHPRPGLMSPASFPLRNI